MDMIQSVVTFHLPASTTPHPAEHIRDEVFNPLVRPLEKPEKKSRRQRS